MGLESLYDLLLDELRDLYHAELQIAKTLPRLGKAVASASGPVPSQPWQAGCCSAASTGR
jgi:hypothetical protein